MMNWSEEEFMYTAIMMDRSLRRHRRGEFECREVMEISRAFLEGVENDSLGKVGAYLKRGMICLSEAIDAFVHERNRKELLESI